MNKQIESRFQYFRLKILKMSQEELAKILQMKQSNISRIEKGTTLPTSKTIIEMHNRFRLNVNWLLLGIGEPVFSENSNETNENSIIVKNVIDYQFEERMIEVLSECNEVKNKYIKLLEKQRDKK